MSCHMDGPHPSRAVRSCVLDRSCIGREQLLLSRRRSNAQSLTLNASPTSFSSPAAAVAAAATQ